MNTKIQNMIDTINNNWNGINDQTKIDSPIEGYKYTLVADRFIDDWSELGSIQHSLDILEITSDDLNTDMPTLDEIVNATLDIFPHLVDSLILTPGGKYGGYNVEILK